MNTSPLESIEQTTLVEWLELNQLKFTAIPNSTFTKSWAVKARNKREGVRAGFPDLIILISPKQARDNQGHMFCVELKRRKGGVVSEVQKEWHIALNGLKSPHVEAIVAHGADEAMTFIETYLKHSSTSPF